MTRRLKLDIALYTLLVLFLYALGVRYHLFYRIFEYDKILHFIAGVWVALVILWLFRKRTHILPKYFNECFKKRPVLTLIVLTLVVGGLWEIFEFLLVQYSVMMYDYELNLQPSHLDTFLDLVADGLGALFVSYYYLIKQGVIKK